MSKHLLLIFTIAITHQLHTMETKQQTKLSTQATAFIQCFKEKYTIMTIEECAKFLAIAHTKAIIYSLPNGGRAPFEQNVVTVVNLKNQKTKEFVVEDLCSITSIEFRDKQKIVINGNSMASFGEDIESFILTIDDVNTKNQWADLPLLAHL